MNSPEAFLVKLAMQSAATWHALGPRIFPGEMMIETDGSVYRFSAGLLVSRMRKSGDPSLPPTMRGLRLIGFLAEESGLYSFSPRFREGAHAVLWKPDPSVAVDESAFILTSPARSAHVDDPVRAATPISGVMRIARPSVPKPQPSSVTRIHCAR